MTESPTSWQAEREDLLMRVRLLQKYSLMSAAGLILSLLGLKYREGANLGLLVMVAVLFAVSLALKLYFALKWQRRARLLAAKLAEAGPAAKPGRPETSDLSQKPLG